MSQASRAFTLRELQVEFRGHNRGPNGERFITKAGPFADAQCVWFLCPVCFEKNGGDVGTHWIEVGLAGRGAPADMCSHNRSGAPSRWAFSGTGADDLALSPSIDISSSNGAGCGWHGFVGSSGVPPGHAR